MDRASEFYKNPSRMSAYPVYNKYLYVKQRGGAGFQFKLPREKNASLANRVMNTAAEEMFNRVVMPMMMYTVKKAAKRRLQGKR